MKAETRDALDTEFAGSLKADIGQLAGYPVRPDIGYSGYFFFTYNNIFCKKNLPMFTFSTKLFIVSKIINCVFNYLPESVRFLFKKTQLRI